MINKEELPDIDLTQLGTSGTAKPPIMFSRLNSQTPMTQPDSNLFAATFFRDTTIGSLLTKPESTAFDPEANRNNDFMKFVPRRHLSQFDAYALVTNEEEAFSVMRTLDEENERTRMVFENPWKSFFYNFGSQFLDPVNLIPGSVIFNNVQRMSRVAKGALQAGASGVISTVAQEAIIQGNQLSREVDESIANTLVAGLFSSVIGGVAPIVGPKIGTMTKDVRERAKRELLDVFVDKAKNLTAYGLLSGNEIANMPGFVQKGMVTSLMNRMYKSDFESPKNVASELYQSNYTLVKNESGAPNINAETAIKLDISEAAAVAKDYQDIFFEQAGVKRGLLAESRANKAAMNDPTGQILNFEKFDSAVAYTIFSGEKHANEGVNKAAKLFQEKILEPYKNAAIQLGLLPEDVSPKNAFSYFSVHWNHQKIKENQGGFLLMTTEWFNKVNNVVKDINKSPSYKAAHAEAQNLQKQFKKAKQMGDKEKMKALKKKLAEAEEKLSQTARNLAARVLATDEVEGIFHTRGKYKGRLRKHLTESQIEASAQQTLDRILGNDGSPLKSAIVNQLNGKKSPLKDRTYLIPQRIAFEWQNQSASDVMNSYVHAMAPVIRMTEMAKSLGFDSIKQWHDFRIDHLKKEMHVDVADITGKEAAKIDKEFKVQRQNITDSFNLLLGIYGDGPNIHDNSAAKYYKAFLNWNYIRLLGFMTLSSIPDVGLHVLTHGPFASVYHGLRPVLKSAFGIMKNMSKDDLQAMGYGINTYSGARLKSMAGHEGLSTAPSFFGKTFDKLVNSFGNITLMNQWNDVNQIIAGTMSINRTLKAVEAHHNGTLAKDEMIRLARLGIDPSEYATIYDLWVRSGKGQDGGTYFADWNNWKIKNDKEGAAFQSFRRAVATEIDSVVIIPGLGDKPLVAQTNLGKLLLQFKSFAFASTNKILFAGIQRRHDMNTYFGMVTMLAMGSLSYLVTQAIRGNDEIDLSFGKLSHEAIDRSGLLGIVSEVYNLAQKAGLGFGTQASRYQSRSLWGALLGPSTGAFDEMLSLVNSIRKADGEHPLTTKDFEKLLRLAPYQNLFYTYYLSRKVSGAIAPKLGFEETQDKRLKDIFK